MPAGIALAVERPTPADGELELDHRLQPVDVGPFEEAGLDQSHGPGRIASGHGLDCTAMDAPTAIPPAPLLERLRAAIAADLPAYLADLERLVNTDCGSYTPAGVNEIGRWTGRFLANLGASVETRPDPAGRLGDTRDRHLRRARPVRLASCSSGTWTRSSTRAPRRPDHSGSRTASPTARA